MDEHTKEIAARDYAITELVGTCMAQRKRIEELTEVVRELITYRIAETA